MKYKVGDRVRIVDKWADGCGQNSHGEMDKWLGKVMTIHAISGSVYRMQEDKNECLGKGWFWNDNCISGLANNQKIVITTDGKDTLARLYENNKVVKSAEAKCSPTDDFNFNTGAKIAFDRLAKPEFVPHLKFNYGNKEMLGNIGEKSGMTAIFGEPLFLGDVVELYNCESKKSCGNRYVCKDEIGKSYVMGVKGHYFKNGVSNNWQIRKVKSYKDLEHNERVYEVIAKLKED